MTSPRSTPRSETVAFVVAGTAPPQFIQPPRSPRAPRMKKIDRSFSFLALLATLAVQFLLRRAMRIANRALTGLAGVVLVLDPRVGLGEAFLQRRRRLPVERLLDESVVAVAARDAAGGVQVVAA